MRPSTLIAAGLIVGQGVVYLATPLLARLYSPQEIGTAAAVMAAAGVIAAVATFRLELMVPGAPDVEVKWLVRRAAALMVVVAAVLSPIAGFVLGLSPLDTLLTGLTAIGISFVALSLQVASRVQELRGVAAAKALQGIGQTVTQVCLAVPAGPIGMQAGVAVGLLAAGGVQAMSARSHVQALPTQKPNPLRVRAIARSALLLTCAAACNAAVVAALPLLTQIFFDERATGELAVAQRLALAPAGLVVAAVLPVVITQFGKQVRTDATASRTIVLRWLKRLIPLGLIATSALLAAPLLPLAELLGDEWKDVGGYVAAMAPQIGAQLIVGPLSQCLVIQERTRTQLVWDVARVIAVFGAAVSVVMLGGDAVFMVAMISVVLVVAYAVYVCLVLYAAPKQKH